MKKVLITVMLVAMTFCFLVACNDKPSNTQNQDFIGIVFENQTIDYDGEEHTITATGVPEGANLEYTNVGPYVLPGSYEISVEITKEGYNLYTKTAVLRINALTFSSIEFENKTIDYDGEDHTITATGVPEGVSAVYTNAGPYKNAGEYDISIAVSAEGYNTYTKSVKLVINKIDFPSTITFENKKVMYTGGEKNILISGELPEGTQIQYTNNKGTEVGEYNAVATLTNPNYNSKTLRAILTIYNVINAAKTTIDTILDRPDPWSFMPEAFSKSSLANTTNPVKDFSSFVNVSDINKKFMGKQMYVLWEGVNGMDTLLEKFDMVYAVGETIATAYQNFINANPDNCAEWIGSAAGFNIKVVLDGNQSTMLVGNSVFSLELFADADENVNKGRIEVAQGGILNYEMSDNYLKFNVALTIKGVLVMKQIEFARDDDGNVAGCFYEYAGVKSVAVKTSAVVAFNDDYAIVTSTKRESDDLLIKGYEEVYSSKTGQYISAEVLENNKLTDFDTFWVNIYDVSGINNVRVIRNDKTSLNENLHDIYINNSNQIFKSVKNKIGFVETSRKFDIEMKTIYYVVASTEGGETTYSVQETEIPMLFVQKKNIEDFSSDIVKENDFTIPPTLPTAKIQVAQNNFSTMYELLTFVKEELTYDELENQLGTKDSFFN